MAGEQSPPDVGNGKVVSRVLYLLFGLGIGALLAVLFASKSGSEARELVQRKARSASDYAQKKAQQMQQRAGTLVEQGKEMVKTKNEQIAAAVDAGRDAYRQEIAKAKSRATD